MAWRRGNAENRSRVEWHEQNRDRIAVNVCKAMCKAAAAKAGIG